MVEIRPFKALMYDWDEVDGDAATATAPPYDVITDEALVRFKRCSMHNVTRLTLPDPTPGKAPETKYENAAKLLKRWKRDGVLHRRKASAFFAYDETHTVDGERRTVHGFFGLLRLDPDYEHVRPHERTHKGPIADRLELLKATATDLEPIQFLYVDPEGEVNARVRAATEGVNTKPLADFVDDEGNGHRLWEITDEETLDFISTWFEPRDVYIADGHHRYATAIEYAGLRAAAQNGSAPEDPSYGYKLALFCAREDPAIAVYATYRLIEGLDDPAAARSSLQDRFTVEPLQVEGEAADRAFQLNDLIAQAPADTHRYVFYWGDGQADVVDVPASSVDQTRMGDHSEAWKRLDVSVLHQIVLPDALGVDADNASDHLRYTRIPEEGTGWVDEGRHQCAVFLAATPLQAVTDIADARDHMPQKSTYFQPKSASGLLFSSLS